MHSKLFISCKYLKNQNSRHFATLSFSLVKKISKILVPKLFLLNVVFVLCSSRYKLCETKHAANNYVKNTVEAF